MILIADGIYGCNTNVIVAAQGNVEPAMKRKRGTTSPRINP